MLYILVSPVLELPSPHSLTTASALIIPVYSAIIRWLGSIEASNKKLREALSEGSCNVVVDGIAGMYVNEPDKEMVKFSGRKGFIRAAVETGTPIVPAFNFGNSRLLALIPKFLEKPARKLQCAMGIIVGRWGLPFPKKIMLLTVAGKPIEVKKMSRDDPHYSEYVDEVQQKVADELQRVYYKYRCVYGWENRPMEIYSCVCAKHGNGTGLHGDVSRGPAASSLRAGRFDDGRRHERRVGREELIAEVLPHAMVVQRVADEGEVVLAVLLRGEIVRDQSEVRDAHHRHGHRRCDHCQRHQRRHEMVLEEEQQLLRHGCLRLRRRQKTDLFWERVQLGGDDAG